MQRQVIGQEMRFARPGLDRNDPLGAVQLLDTDTGWWAIDNRDRRFATCAQLGLLRRKAIAP